MVFVYHLVKSDAVSFGLDIKASFSSKVYHALYQPRTSKVSKLTEEENLGVPATNTDNEHMGRKTPQENNAEIGYIEPIPGA